MLTAGCQCLKYCSFENEIKCCCVVLSYVCWGGQLHSQKIKTGIQVEADIIDLLRSLAHAHLPRTIGGKHVLHSFLLIPGLWS